MNNQKINDQLAQLKVARDAADFYKNEMKVMIETVKASPNYVTASQGALNAEQVMSETREKIEAEVLLDFRLNENKHPHEKVEVKIFKTFKVVDLKAVREWCFKNLPVALQPDLKKVEAYAKDLGGNVDGTELGEEPRVQIAKEL